MIECIVDFALSTAEKGETTHSGVSYVQLGVRMRERDNGEDRTFVLLLIDCAGREDDVRLWV